MADQYMTHAECKAKGYEPYAVYGGKVYSFWETGDNGTGLVPHGSKRYAQVRDKETEQPDE